MIVVANTDPKKTRMWGFLKERGVQLQRSEDFQAIGRVGASGDLIGVVAYNGFNGNVCQMHIAGDGNWVSREFIKVAFDYPFNQLGLVAILAPVPANNRKALRFDQHFGFKEIYRIAKGWVRFTEGKPMYVA